MSKGRGTTVIGIRLPDDIVLTLQDRADKQGLSVGEYIKIQILKSLNQSVNAIEIPPVYNPAIHKSGDKVRVMKFKKWQEVVVPEIDGDGHAIPELR